MVKITVKVGLEKTEIFKDGEIFLRYPTKDVTVLAEAKVDTEIGRAWIDLKNINIADLIPVEEGGNA